MKTNLLLRFMNRQEKEGTLAHTFTPDDNKIEVVLADNQGGKEFSLSDLSCILMKNNPGYNPAPNEKIILEEVEVVNGGSYYVRVADNQDYQTGFFGVIPEDTETTYKYAFFTYIGIRSRKQLRPLGNILQEHGVVSKEELDNVLDEQKALKESRTVGGIVAARQSLNQDTIEETIRKMQESGHLPRNARIGELLVAAGLITQEQLDAALTSQANTDKKQKIGALLIERGLVSEAQIMAALSTKFRLHFVNLDEMEPNEKALAALSPDIVTQLQVFPVEDRADRLVVAISKPADQGAISDALRFHANRRVELVVATAEQISAAIVKYYGRFESQMSGIIGELTLDAVAVEEEEQTAEDSRIGESDSEIIRLVNKLLLEAYGKGASDIHIEPGLERSPLQVRYRIDGVCSQVHQIPSIYKRAIISRIKIMSNLDISERRKPQSGKILIHYKRQKMEFRVEITPTVGGQEDAVLRILAKSKPLPLEQMGFSPSTLESFRQILSKPYGIILCVGPTGSGKTTTLHSALGHINTPERKIWTAEDPVEITQPGLRQVQVNPRIGFTFQEAFRSFLRADPDVVMIGEMRDFETAKIAIEASLTGHLVFSTLHTNSAPETVVRLIEMGLDPLGFAEALLGILAQRLGRKLCDQCKQPYHPDQSEYNTLVEEYLPKWFKDHQMPAYTDELMLNKKNGCSKCGNNGYRGRVGIHELLLGTEQVKTMIKKKGGAEELKAAAMQDGMRTLKMDGIYKTFKGILEFEQVLKVCL